MIATMDAGLLIPLEYRYALEAAMSTLASRAAPLVCCNISALSAEAQWRLPDAGQAVADSALWLEPLSASWCEQLAALSGQLPPGAPLVTVCSLPLARLIPERRGWTGSPLGMRLHGLATLRRSLNQMGWDIRELYQIHTVHSMLTSALSRLLEHFQRPDLGDRMRAAAQLRYCSALRVPLLATVALLIAYKER